MAMKNKISKAATGIIGGVVVACAACCLPLAVPAVAALLTGAGVYGIGEGIKPWHIGGATLLMFAVTFSWMWTRRKSRTSAAVHCGCQNSCTAGSGPSTNDINPG